MLKNEIISTISRRDALKPLDISFKPFANNVCDSKYHKRCSGFTSNHATSPTKLFQEKGHKTS